MEYNLIIKPEADIEISEALLWQENQKIGLGIRLSEEFRKTLMYIQKCPEHSQKKYQDVHIRFTKKFNYGVHYIIEENNIYVIAVLHTSRKPKK